MGSKKEGRGFRVKERGEGPGKRERGRDVKSSKRGRGMGEGKRGGSLRYSRLIRLFPKLQSSPQFFVRFDTSLGEIRALMSHL